MVRHTNKRRHTKRRRHTRRTQRGGGFFDNLFSSKKPEQTAEEEAVKKECETKLEAIKKKYSGAEGATVEGAATQGAAQGTTQGATTSYTTAPQIRKPENLAYRGYDENTNKMAQGQGEGAGINSMFGGRSRRRRRHRRK